MKKVNILSRFFMFGGHIRHLFMNKAFRQYLTPLFLYFLPQNWFFWLLDLVYFQIFHRTPPRLRFYNFEFLDLLCTNYSMCMLQNRLLTRLKLKSMHIRAIIELQFTLIACRSIYFWWFRFFWRFIHSIFLIYALLQKEVLRSVQRLVLLAIFRVECINLPGILLICVHQAIFFNFFRICILLEVLNFTKKQL